MNLKSQRRVAAEILKCGVNRVRIEQTKDVEEALTRGDIKRLIVKGVIKKAPVKGIARKNAKETLVQKKKGRRTGRGSKKGTKGAVQTKKERWIKKVRALRKTIKELRDNEQITVTRYRSLYQRIKGNAFRNKRHLLTYLKEEEILKPRKIKKTKTVKKPKTDVAKKKEVKK